MEYRIYKGYKVFEDGIVQRISTGKFMSQSNNAKGYKAYSLLMDGRRVCIGVQRLVAFAWLGTPPDDGKYYEADHIDSNRLNNHKDNIQWLTKSQNNQKSWDNGLKDNRGVKNGRCITPIEDVKDICIYLQGGCSVSEIVSKGYKRNTVYSIKQRKNWKWFSKDYTW